MLSQASLSRDWLANRWVARCASATARSAGVSGGGAGVFVRSLGLRGRGGGGGGGGGAGGIFLPAMAAWSCRICCFVVVRVFVRLILDRFAVEGYR